MKRKYVALFLTHMMITKSMNPNRKIKKPWKLIYPLVMTIILFALTLMLAVPAYAEGIIVDQQQTWYNAYTTAYTDSGDKLSQTFTPGFTGTLQTVSAGLLIKETGTGVRLDIHNVDASGKPTGTVIATRTVTCEYPLDQIYWFEFAFSSPPTLVGGTKYAMVLSPTGAGQRFEWHGNRTAVYPNKPDYPGGQAWKWTGSDWVNPSYDVGSGIIDDFTFKTYMQLPIDQQQTSMDISYNTGSHHLAQTFRAGATGRLQVASLYIRNENPTPVIHRVGLTTVDYSGLPGTTLATVDIEFPKFASWVEVTLPESPGTYVVEGTSYALTLSLLPGHSEPLTWLGSSSNSYPNGQVCTAGYASTLSWTAIAGRDFAFRTYVNSSYTDPTAPTGSININSGADLSNSASVTLNLAATDNIGVTGYRVANGTNASGSTTTTVTSTQNFSTNISWVLEAGDGSKTVAVQYRDAAGNWSPNYTHSITLDATAPAVSLIALAGSSPTNAASVGYTVTFNEPVTGVESGDFAVTTTGDIIGATVSGVSPVNDTIYTVTVTTGSGSGTIRLDIPSGATITDVAGNNLSNLPYITGPVYNIDKGAPTVIINQAVSQEDPTVNSIIHFTVFFSEPVNGFDNADVILSGTAGANTKVITQISPQDGTTYNVAVSGMTSTGTVIVEIAASSVTDLAGNFNTTASTSTDNTVYYYHTATDAATPGNPDVGYSKPLTTDSFHSKVGQTFTAGTTGQFIAFQACLYGGNNNHDVTVEIYDADSGVPSGEPLVKQTFNVYIASGYDWKTFILSTPTGSLISGHRYALVLSGSLWEVGWRGYSTDVYSGGNSLVYSGSWTSPAYYGSEPMPDFAFRTYRLLDADVTAPAVSGVTSSKADGTYGLGEVIPIQVAFNEPVIVSGTPRIQLETGITDQYADYVSGSGTPTLTFNYTVQLNDTASNLDYVSTTALEANDGTHGTIKDAANNNADLTLPEPGTAGSLGANKAITINANTYTVTYSVVNGNGTLSATVDGTAIATGSEVEEGKDVVFTATPHEWYCVKAWTLGGTTVADNTSTTYTEENLTKDINVTVEFELITPDSGCIVAVSANLAEGGTVTGEGNYETGDRVKVTASANEGYCFINWTEGGTVVSKGETYNFKMGTENRSLVANFEATTEPTTEWLVTVSAKPSGGGLVTGEDMYAEGEWVKVTATASDGYRFINWTEGLTEVSAIADYSFIMDTKEHSLTANFILAEQIAGWPKGIRLSAIDITATSATLQLSQPVPDATAYLVFRDGEFYKTFEDSSYASMLIDGLKPSTFYTFTVQAVYPDKIVTTDGPSVKVKTKK